MPRTRVILLAAMAIAIVLWALRFVPGAGLPIDLSDFFGGLAVGTTIGVIVTWVGERTPD